MRLASLIKVLEEYAPPVYQESYDNSGLIIGEPDQDVRGVLVSLDCTEQVVDEAIALNCNVIVSHHPIIFKGLKRITGKSYIERVVLKAIRNHIAIYAIHTNLDHVHNGVNAVISERLGLKNLRILSPKSGLLK